ncbi:MAG: N-acetylmuramoyl-L-alanine amidase family protein [Hungatella sp.]|nr:N-acetylmuramoyl-L-alanine amidase family protein [Hungatella sp.]
MYQKIRRWAAFLLACLCVAAAMPMEALAATKPINTVNVKISAKLKAGEKLPDIQVGDGGAEDGKIMVGEKGSHYRTASAEWMENASKEMTAGDEPRMLVTLEPEDVSEYYFLASYKSSNVKVSGGTFVSARRDGDNLVVTLRVNPIKGDYEAPKDAYWDEKKLGQAKWEKPETGSGYYEVQLMRDQKNVFKVDQTSATTYNFYPYMTKTGSYSFKIRTVPGTDFQKKHGKKSDWLESGELEITDRYVSDGKGQQSSSPETGKGTDKTVGWSQEDGVWHYRYPSGALSTNTWEYIDGQWYYFDGNGAMATGWQRIGREWYFFHGSGQMAVGWVKIDDKWYYFRPEEERDHTLGSMASPGWREITGYHYYFNEDGSAYTGWLTLDGRRYYLNTLDNSLQGALFTGWIRRDEKTYFADENGVIAEGWYQIDGHWYYFYPGSGEMAHDTRVDGFDLDSDGIWR